MQIFYTEEVHAVMEEDLRGQKKIISLFAKLYKQRRSLWQAGRKDGMGIDEFVKLLKDAGAVSHTLTEEIVCKCFKMAAPVCKSHGNRNDIFFAASQEGKNAQQTLPLPCFVEALWRVACCSLASNVESSETAEEVIALLETWLSALKKK